MTVEDVAERVQSVAREANDDASAHAHEDRLWHDVLAAIAEGAENPAQLAAEALKTVQIDFSRRFA